MAVKIFFTSLKGGAGVTTCAVGLGFALSEAGEKTLVLDGDEQVSSALCTAGLAPAGGYTLQDAERGACRVKQAIVRHPKTANLYLLPTLGCEDEEYIIKALREVEGLFDYIICDGAAAGFCTKAVVVTEPYPLSVKCADRRLAQLKDAGFRDAGVIVNKINGGLVFDGEIMTPQETASLLRAPLTGVIPEDLGVPLGKCRKDTLRAFAAAAECVRGKSDKTVSIIKPYLGVGGIIKRKMRLKI